MTNKPTNLYTCEVAYCASMHVNDILYSLLRKRKGPEHTIVVDGSIGMNRKQRTYRMYQLKEKVRRLKLPYVLRFYERGPAIVCYWLFDDETKRLLKEWYDRQEKEGIYPDVSSMGMVPEKYKGEVYNG